MTDLKTVTLFNENGDDSPENQDAAIIKKIFEDVHNKIEKELDPWPEKKIEEKGK